MIPSGRQFFKMSGSGNDFIMVDCRSQSAGPLADAETISKLCGRGTGVGADGVVFLERSTTAAIRLVYLNADGSRAEFCGNATLCTGRLAVELGAADPVGFAIETDSGIVHARGIGGEFEIDLHAVNDVRPVVDGIQPAIGERRIGYAAVGVPHVTVLCEDVGTIDLAARGPTIRGHPTLPRGANANFVSRGPAGLWHIRTYERGVEAETLACGSGSVASAVLLAEWSEAPEAVPVGFLTRSGRVLRVRLSRSDAGWTARLSGEARIVFQGTLSEL